VALVGKFCRRTGIDHYDGAADRRGIRICRCPADNVPDAMAALAPLKKGPALHYITSPKTLPGTPVGRRFIGVFAVPVERLEPGGTAAKPRHRGPGMARLRYGVRP